MRTPFIFLVACLWLTDLAGQVALTTQEQRSSYSLVPQETIYVHANASFFLTGEYLYYKLYCSEGMPGHLTTLSKVAYVELVGKNGLPIFRHKIRLRQGQGYGDFFIPTQISSGSYKLIAYTRWMANQTDQSFYEADITIVNPYRSNQPELLKNNTVTSDSLVSDSTIANKKLENSGPLNLVLNDGHFGNRARVKLTLKAKDRNRALAGNYSLSVRKKDIVEETGQSNISAGFMKPALIGTEKALEIGDSITMPELRGELYQGKVIAVSNQKSVGNLKVAASIPGEDYVLEIVQTDADGRFHFNVSKAYSDDKLVLQVLSQNPDDYKIRIDTPYEIDYSKLDFKEVQLDVSIREEILRRSIHNQIENSFFQFRPDSIMTVTSEHFLDSKERKTYNLDDYTRFKTLRETLVEIVQDVSSKRIGPGNFAIGVKGYDYASTADIPPLILLDGCLIQNHNGLLDYDTRLVEKIEVYRHKFIYGPELYEGALVLETKDGSGYEAVQNTESVSVLELLMPQTERKYFVQRYDTILGGDKKLPDDRLQLLWKPDLQVEGKEFEIDFFTSDVTGEFEIRFEGITENNEPVSIRETFMVD